MNKGILAGIGAGVFWGLPFVVPAILGDFSNLEIIIGRFLFFGAVSLLFLPCAIRLFISLSLKDKLLVALLSVSGFSLYSFLLFVGVRYTGGIISSLIEGMMPVIIVLLSRPNFNRLLLAGTTLILLGFFFLLVLPSFLTYKPMITTNNVIGILSLLTSLFMWIWFANYNSKFLKRHTDINLKHYTALVGIINLALISPYLLIGNFSSLSHHPQIYSYLIWSAALGIGSSWIANWLWSFCSKTTPLSISGILIVSETIFGLIYSLTFQQRLPYSYEALAIILLITGTISVIKSQN